MEFAAFNAMHFFFTLSGLLLGIAGLGSASIFTVFSVGSLFALVINALAQSTERHGNLGHIGVKAYFIALLCPTILGTELTVSLLTIFVPLTGRMGEVRIVPLFVFYCIDNLTCS